MVFYKLRDGSEFYDLGMSNFLHEALYTAMVKAVYFNSLRDQSSPLNLVWVKCTAVRQTTAAELANLLREFNPNPYPKITENGGSISFGIPQPQPPSGETSRAFPNIKGYWRSTFNNTPYVIEAFWSKFEDTGESTTIFCVFPLGVERRIGNEWIRINGNPVLPGSNRHAGKIYERGWYRGGIPIQLELSPNKIVSEDKKLELIR